MSPEAIDPFGESAPQWWRRLIAPEGPKHAPRRYLGIAAMIGPTLGLFVPARHRLAVIIPGVALFALPPALVEAWFKARSRRREEELLLPAGQQARSAFGAAAGPVDRDGHQGE